ncbi:hypothetical protein PIB30_102203 [Stylosanthes scabra]|uniref:Uncharacterized protein n=1 Tax=Stylosanthes scabra TaxID=79078 RepID=A0ABU6SY64_9FABA|nr:hypothetical protein [Stylosanthes scabra]
MDEQVSGDRPPTATPKTIQVMKDDLEERVVIWAMVPKGDNEFETIFKLRGHRILKALRYQFTSMAPKSYIDIQVVTLMCHVLNADEDERFEKLIYCVPPKILQRMFATHNHNWMDKKKRRPPEISSLLNHTEFLAYLDREKLNSHRFWMEMIDPTILAGCCTYNIEQWTEPMLLEFRQKIVAKIILSKENSLRAEAIKEAHNMRLTRPAVALRSPYVQVETPDLPTK